MSDAIRRAVRTLLQALTAAAGGLGALVAADVLDGQQAVKVGAVLSTLAAVVSAGWNAWEDRTGSTLLVAKTAPLDRP